MTENAATNNFYLLKITVFLSPQSATVGPACGLDYVANSGLRSYDEN